MHKSNDKIAPKYDYVFNWIFLSCFVSYALIEISSFLKMKKKNYLCTKPIKLKIVYI